jgi:hypothetical protein
VTGKKDLCDYNLLSGKGTHNGKKVRVKTKAPLLSELQDSEHLYECKNW